MRKALVLAKNCGGARTHHCAEIYRGLFDCLLQENKIQAAADTLAEAGKLDELTGEAQARQILMRMKLEIIARKLEPMFDQFLRMIELCGDKITTNQQFSSFTKTHIDPLSIRLADEMWASIYKEHYQSAGDKMLAVKLGLMIGKLEVEKQCPAAASRSLRGADALLRQLNKSVSGYAEAEQQIKHVAEQGGIDL